MCVCAHQNTYFALVYAQKRGLCKVARVVFAVVAKIYEVPGII